MLHSVSPSTLNTAPRGAARIARKAALTLLLLAGPMAQADLGRAGEATVVEEPKPDSTTTTKPRAKPAPKSKTASPTETHGPSDTAKKPPAKEGAGAPPAKPEAAKQPKTGWDFLLANRVAEAKKRLEAERDGAKDGVERLVALQGLAACADMEGDEDGAWGAVLAQARIAATLPGGLADYFLPRLQAYAHHWDREAEWFAALEDLWAKRKDLPPANRRWIQDQLRDRYVLRREYEKADALREGDGRIRAYGRLVGPFRAPHGVEMAQALPFERDPGGAGPWTDALQRPVAIVPAPATDRDGVLDPREHLASPFAFVWYAQTNPRLEAAAEAILWLDAPRGLRIWLRGELIHDAAAHEFAPRTQSRALRVRLAKGDNPLLIKVEGWRDLSLRLLTPEGAPLEGVAYPPFQADPWRPCMPSRGVLLSAPWEPPVERALASLAKQAVAARLWRGAYLAQTGKTMAGRTVFDALLDEYPKSAYILTTVGRGRLAQIAAGIDSPERLRKEAMDLFRRAEKAHPGDCRAGLERLEIFQDANQEKQALRIADRLVETYPAAVEPRLWRARLRERKGWLALARADLATAVKRRPGARQHLAAFDLRHDRLAEGAKIIETLWTERALAPERYFRHLLQWRRWRDAATVRATWSAGHPNRPRRAHRLELLLAEQQGDLKAMEILLEQRCAWEPENERPWRERGAALLRAGKREEAIATFAAADQIATANREIDLGLRRRLRALRGEAWPLRGYDIPLAKIDAAGVEKADHPRANAATILRLRVTRVLPDRGAEHYVHEAIKVLDAAAKASLAEMDLPRGDDLFFARTVQPDGTIDLPLSKENVGVGKGLSMYNVQVGSVLEYAYREESSGGWGAGFHDTFQAEDFENPVIRARYVLIVPKELAAERLSLRAVPETARPVESETETERLYTWDYADVPGRKPEPFLPREPVLATIEASIPAEGPWGQRRALALAAPIRTDRAIKERAVALTRDATTDAERTARIYAWIAASIEDGGPARTARDAFHLKAGTPVAKLRLCRAMLAAVGIQSALSRVNRRLNVPGLGTPEARRAWADDFQEQAALHVIIPEDRDRWLRFQDPSRNYRIDDLGTRMAGALALDETPMGLNPTLVREGQLGAASEEDLTYVLHADGSAAVPSATILFFGDYAGRLRTIAENAQQAKQYVEGLAARVAPRIQLAGTPDYPEPATDRIAAAARPYEPFVVRFRGRVASFAQREGEGLVFAPFRGDLGVQRLLTPKPRTYPYAIGNDMVFMQRARYVAPEGWTFATVPADRCIESDFGYYVADFTVEGRRLRCTRMLVTPSQTVAPEHFEVYHRFLTEVRKTEEDRVSLRRLPLKDFGDLRTAYRDGGPVATVDPGRFRIRYWPRETATPAAAMPLAAPSAPDDEATEATAGAAPKESPTGKDQASDGKAAPSATEGAEARTPRAGTPHAGTPREETPEADTGAAHAKPAAPAAPKTADGP